MHGCIVITVKTVKDTSLGASKLQTLRAFVHKIYITLPGKDIAKMLITLLKYLKLIQQALLLICIDSNCVHLHASRAEQLIKKTWRKYLLITNHSRKFNRKIYFARGGGWLTIIIVGRQSFAS